VSHRWQSNFASYQLPILRLSARPDIAITRSCKLCMTFTVIVTVLLKDGTYASRGGHSRDAGHIDWNTGHPGKYGTVGNPRDEAVAQLNSCTFWWLWLMAATQRRLLCTVAGLRAGLVPQRRMPTLSHWGSESWKSVTPHTHVTFDEKRYYYEVGEVEPI
jgi:hypothetical protein